MSGFINRFFSRNQVENTLSLLGDTVQNIVLPDRPNDVSPDDRLKVADVEKDPWRRLVRLRLVFGEGRQKREVIGSGVLIAPNVVLTAAHNLYSLARKTFVRTAIAEVGVKGGRFAATAIAKRVEVCPGYADFANAGDDPRQFSYDFGVVRLDSNALYDWCKSTVDACKQDPIPDDDLARSILIVAGYPQDDPAVLKFNEGRPLRDSIDSTKFLYRMDTSAGQSGGPVFRYHAASQQFVLAGVHVGNVSRGNIARRFNPGMKNRLTSWLNGFST